MRDFSARGPNGQTYKLVDNAPPNGIVYNDGLQDILMWTSNVPGTPMPGQPGMTGSGEPSDSGPLPGALPAPATT